jgi:hypothetical protein
MSIDTDNFFDPRGKAPPKPKRQPKAEKLAEAVAAGLDADRAQYAQRRLRPTLRSWLRPIDRPEMLGLVALRPTLIPGVTLPATTRAAVRIDPEAHGFKRTLVTVDQSYWQHAVRAAAGGRLYGPTDVYGHDYTHSGISLGFVSTEAVQ